MTARPIRTTPTDIHRSVIENFGRANARTIPTIEQIDQAIEDMAGGTAVYAALPAQHATPEAVNDLASEVFHMGASARGVGACAV